MPGGARGIPATATGRRLRRHRKAVIDAAERRGARNVRVFGSSARGTDTDSSDIDPLVDLDPDVAWCRWSASWARSSAEMSTLSRRGASSL